MSRVYHALNTVKLNAACDYIHGGDLPEVVHLDDGAIHAMTDLRRICAVTMPLKAPIDAALTKMHSSGVHMLFVMDENDKMAGIVSSQDILGEKPLRITQEKGFPRKDITIDMVMMPDTQITTIPLHEVFMAKVGNVLQTLKETNQYYALVVETEPVTGGQKVRGIFSLTTICRQLNIDINPTDLMATNLADLQSRFREF